MDFEVLGRKIEHPVRVLQHVTEDIIGIDFLNAHHLWYDPVYREVFFNKTKERATLSMMSETQYCNKKIKRHFLSKHCSYISKSSQINKKK